jgi:hypothetical protein
MKSFNLACGLALILVFCVLPPSADAPVEQLYAAGIDELIEGNSAFLDSHNEHPPKLGFINNPAVSFSTYFGGVGGALITELINDVVVDDSGFIYLTGETTSSGLPTTVGVLQESYAGGTDAFVAKFDPDGLRIWATYLGGSSLDRANAIAVDSAGQTYVTGVTGSSDFPGVVDQQEPGDYDIFIAKLSHDGDLLLYSSMVGGGLADEALAMAVDRLGYAYICGATGSSDFPVDIDALQNSSGGSSDVFVIKLHPQNNTIVYGTYFGGSDMDVGLGIDINDAGEAFVAGWTASTDLPVINAYQSDAPGNRNGFVLKLSSDGREAHFATYLGGAETDEATALAVAPDDAAVVVGYTWSDDFPTQGTHSGSHNGASDAFLLKLAPDGLVLDFSYLLGGTAGDRADDCVITANDDICVVGGTGSIDLETVNAVQELHGGGEDLFAMVVPLSGDPPTFSTYFGGSADDVGSEVAVSDYGGIVLGGTTNSTDFPIVNAWQPALSGFLDGFLLALVDSCPGAPPQIVPVDTQFVATDKPFSFVPEVVAADRVVYLVSYMNKPDWCQVDGDSIYGISPSAYQRDSVTVKVSDGCGADTASFLLVTFLCGDVEYSQTVNVGDIVALISYVFGAEAPTIARYAADVECSNSINVGDIVYLIQYIFAFGPPPCDCND